MSGDIKLNFLFSSPTASWILLIPQTKTTTHQDDDNNTGILHVVLAFQGETLDRPEVLSLVLALNYTKLSITRVPGIRQRCKGDAAGFRGSQSPGMQIPGLSLSQAKQNVLSTGEQHASLLQTPSSNGS